MSDQSAEEIGNRFQGPADVDAILNGGQPGATTNQLLAAILLELRLLRAAGCEPENNSGV